jgi:ABC-2 type transport system ATP-binding protein
MDTPEPLLASRPLLRAEDARIAVDDVVAVDRLTLETHGDRVLFVGEVDELFAALTGVPLASRARRGGSDERPGQARVVGGTLLVAGKSVVGGAHLASVGAAPLDPPLPATWTTEHYVAWSARLAGASSSSARELASQALTRVGLAASRRRAIGSLALPERRALILAHAVATSPEVVIAEAPLSGLDGASADFVLSAIAAVTEGRGAILSSARLDPSAPESVLSRGASQVVVLLGGEIALEGAPSDIFAGATIYGLTVRANVEPFREELAARGIALKGGPQRFSAALPEGSTTREILAAARASKAAIVELVPLL